MILERPPLFSAPPRATTPTTVSMRPYQSRTIAAIGERRAPGARILVVAPTGAGKTVIASQLILDELSAGGRVLFIAHRVELISQTYAKLLTMGLGEQRVGVLMADGVITHPITGQRVCCTRPLAPVQVASIDTLRNRRRPQGITLVIVDECHRSVSKSYRDVLDHYPEALSVGLTATPYRGDGRGLGDVWRELYVVTTPKELMVEGFLAEPRVFTHPVKPDLSKVKITAGDYDQGELEKAVDKKELLGNLVEHWTKHLAGVRTVAFASSVAHSKHIAESFVAQGIPAEHLDGETAPEIRSGILTRIDRGETLVVSNCGVLVEGWDQPSVKGCILACPTKSPTKYIQCAGRVLRPWQSMTPTILDHGGSVLEHGLPQDDREYSLEGKKKKEKGIASAKECPQCFGASPANTSVCPYCGTPFTCPNGKTEGRGMEERDGQLVEIAPGTIPLKKLPADVRELRYELQRFAQRVDQHYDLMDGATNGGLKRRFRKGRADMTPAELVLVREYLVASEPWLVEPPRTQRPRPIRFEVPYVAEGACG